MKISIKIQPGNHRFTMMAEESILSLLQRKDIYISADCGGKGTCGKCKIKILNGKLSITSKDKEHFSTEELEEGFRLACSAYPAEELEIIINETPKSFAATTEFQTFNTIIDNGFEVKVLSLHDMNWKKIKSMESAIHAKLDKYYQLSYKALKSLSVIQNTYLESSQEGKKYPLQLLTKDTRIIDVFYQESFRNYGIAIDIGTTTLGFHLVDLNNGKIMETYSSLNSQRAYGADVISRIESAAAGYLQVLSNYIRKDILEGIKSLLMTSGIDKRYIYSIAIAGNTTMQHILLGLSPTSLGQFPFTATTLGLIEFDFHRVFEDTLLDCTVTLLPGIDAYVGADIVAGILHHEIFSVDKINMLIDMGTNGEIVLGNKEKILATATAAGPALEGGNISCGTGSVPGAISNIRFDKAQDKFQYGVIGEIEPTGLCGSGVIDMVAEGLRLKWIDYTGRLSQRFPNGEIIIAKNKEDSHIKFTHKDIREMQLAKSALRTGIECLVKQYGISYHDIDTVYLAGGFGSNINQANAVEIGLIPIELRNKIIISGNTSLGGAMRYLLDKNCKNQLKTILKIADTINLSNDSDFNNLFIQNMLYEKPKDWGDGE